MWWLWMSIGGLIVFVVLMALGYAMERAEDRRVSRAQAIRARQSAAERQIQQVMQNTIEQMFNTYRGRR